MSKYEFDTILERLKSKLKQSPHSMGALLADEKNEEKAVKIIRWLLDNEKIIRTDEGDLIWKPQKHADNTD